MRLLFTFFIACILSCGNNNFHGEFDSKKLSAKYEKDGTAQMLDSLNKIYRSTNFENHIYNITESLVFFENFLNQKGSNAKGTDIFNYAIILLKAGETDRSIKMFEELLAKLPNLQTIDESTKPFHTQYAIAYMRKGEIDNCVENHSAESCLLPIKGQGIHVNQNGSRAAIGIYEKILEKFPEDLQSRWLLNIAYMTLGEHPGKVPKKWLIPASAFESEYNLPKFNNIAMNLGVDVNSLAGGSITDDFNNDGFIDIIASSWGLRDQIRYFINKGNGAFEEATEKAGLKGITGGLNIRQTDYNNDGHLDFIILRGAWYPKIEMGIQPNSLIRNNGDGTFTDVTIEAGLYSITPTQTAVWVDYNLDGWLDLFIGNERSFNENKEMIFPCEFYHNNGDGTFTNIAPEIGLNILAFVKGAATGDINNDGWPDLYISTMGGPNKLFINQGPQANNQWKFEEITHTAGVQKPHNSFPCWFFDYDNDGLDDIFVSSYYGSSVSQTADAARECLGLPLNTEPSGLYKNNGDLTFTDVTKKAKLHRPFGTMGCNFGDLDNDGFLDFYLGTGSPDYTALIPNRMFRNHNGEYFQDVTTAGGFGHLQKGHGIGFADFDNDGDQDVYAEMGGAYSGDNFQNALFENPGNDNKWITILLEGTTANRAAIGSKVELDITLQNGKNQKLYRTVSPGASFGANSLQLEIGLGDCKKINSVKVKWANRNNEYIDYGEVDFNKKFKITEGKNQVVELPQSPFKFDKSKIVNCPHHL